MLRTRNQPCTSHYNDDDDDDDEDDNRNRNNCHHTAITIVAEEVMTTPVSSRIAVPIDPYQNDDDIEEMMYM